MHDAASGGWGWQRMWCDLIHFERELTNEARKGCFVQDEASRHAVP